MADDPGIDAIVDAVKKDSQAGVRKFLDNLNNLTTANSPTGPVKLAHIASEQFNGTSAQAFGNGTLQAVSPSFTGLAFGGNIASASYTAFKMDETGFYVFGKKVGNDPTKDLKRRVDQLETKTADLVGQIEHPDGLLAKIALAKTEIGAAKTAIDEVKAKLGSLGPQTVSRYLAALSAQIRAIRNRPGASRDEFAAEERRLRDIQASRDAGRIKGAPYEYNKAQIDSLERSIKLLAEAIGI